MPWKQFSTFFTTLYWYFILKLEIPENKVKFIGFLRRILQKIVSICLWKIRYLLKTDEVFL